jgi:hypothetical protein
LDAEKLFFGKGGSFGKYKGLVDNQIGSDYNNEYKIHYWVGINANT